VAKARAFLTICSGFISGGIWLVGMSGGA